MILQANSLDCIESYIYDSNIARNKAMNRLATDKRTAVIAALVEGASINATCRMTEVAKHTVLKLLKDMGCACAAHHNTYVRNLRVRRVQADEIWAFVYGKDKNLTLEQVQAGAGSVWTWTAIDADMRTQAGNFVTFACSIGFREPSRNRVSMYARTSS